MSNMEVKNHHLLFGTVKVILLLGHFPSTKNMLSQQIGDIKNDPSGSHTGGLWTMRLAGGSR